MAEAQSRGGSLSPHVDAEALGTLAPGAIWDAVWRPRYGVLEARYVGETPELAARAFAVEADRLRSVGYRPASVSWSAQGPSNWRPPWRRKQGPALLVVTYRASDEAGMGASE
jgi:hypothetical protein